VTFQLQAVAIEPSRGFASTDGGTLRLWSGSGPPPLAHGLLITCWDNGFQQIAFSRGSLGFVAINNEDFGMDRELQTGMPAGAYCQVLSGDFNLDTRVCSGMTVSVRPDGITRVVVGPKNAFAIHVGSKTHWDVTSLGSTCSAITRSCALRAPWLQT
jgi:hypothetical protein